MRYWDSSALVPLVATEAATARLDALLAADPVILTWWGSRLECASAIARRERAGELGGPLVHEALNALHYLRDSWQEIAPTPQVREQAERLVRVHPLRAADALQLAAGLVAADFRPGSLTFVTLDERLARTAQREGFAVAT
jgi:hypothetical protein